MNSNNSSQIGHTPSEQIFENKTNEIDINQKLSTELVTTSQPFVQLNTTNMIPSPRQVIVNVPLHNNTTTRHEGRRIRRQRRRQRREEQQRIEQELRRERREYQRWQQQQQQPPILQPIPQRSRTQSEIEEERHYLESRGYPEYMEVFENKLLEEYDLEKMDPKERWEQEQLNEFEGFAVLEQLLLIQDQIEQDNEIKDMEEMLEQKQDQTNQEQLIQLQLWEHVTFVIQQLNEN
jgi:hypothetical protein